MEVVETNIPAVKIIQPQVFGDERGFFMETFRDSWFREQIADVSFVQDNHSKSSHGILRGLHFQTEQVQGKLVRVVSGEVFDVAVDLRVGSPTFGQWAGTMLSAKNNRQFWIPAGFAHGFYVTSEAAEFVYKCTDYYHPQSEVSLRWDDPAIGIEWPFLVAGAVPQLSDKDRDGLPFEEIPKFSYGK